MRLSKTHVYDFRANYRQSYYNFDRNDDQLHPAGVAGLFTNHNFATVRKIGSVNFTAYPTNDLRFNFEYYRTATTATLSRHGPWITWGRRRSGGISAGQSLCHPGAVDEVGNRLSGGVNYSVRDWNFGYKPVIKPTRKV